jgi:zinc protease
MIQNRHKALIVLLLVIAGCAWGTAQNASSIPELVSRRLLNDLQVTVASTPNLGDSMTIGLVLRYGSAFDPEEKGGLANLVSRMLMKSTNDKTGKDIQSELEYLGATIEIHCDRDGFRFLLHGSSAKYERALLLLYQIVGEARFEEADFVDVKKSILENLKQSPDPRKRIHDQLEEALFRGTTYARPFAGSVASVSAINMGDVRYFYHRFFSPNQASLQIVGDVPPEQVQLRAARIWGVWVRNDDVPFTFTQPRILAGREVFVEDDPDSPAAQFIIGGLFPRREDPDYLHAQLAGRILQERLTKRLPTSLLTVVGEGRRLASPFYIQGQAAADQAVSQIQDIQNAVREMKQSLVSKEELEAAQKRLVQEFRHELESTNGICNILLDAELYRLGSNYPSFFLESIQRCDLNAIKEAVVDWMFPGGELLLVRGPLKVLQPELIRMGKIQPLIP